MHRVSECVPCLVRQCLDALRRATPDEPRRYACMQAALRLIADAPPGSPPLIAAALQGLIRSYTSCADPYARDKDEATHLGLALLPRLRQAVQGHPRPFEAACRLAIAGNVMDLGVTDRIVADEVALALEQALEGQLDKAAVAAFEGLARASRRTLWLCDNAGETVLDRLVIEQLPPGSVTVAVRGGPVLNDATRADAIRAGLGEVAPIIETGSAVPGTVPADCSPAFRKALGEAELVVAKGQGNYETLEEETGLPVVFMMRVKCAHVSGHTGLPLGSSAVLFSPALTGKSARRGGHAAGTGYRCGGE